MRNYQLFIRTKQQLQIGPQWRRRVLWQQFNIQGWECFVYSTAVPSLFYEFSVAVRCSSCATNNKRHHSCYFPLSTNGVACVYQIWRIDEILSALRAGDLVPNKRMAITIVKKCRRTKEKCHALPASYRSHLPLPHSSSNTVFLPLFISFQNIWFSSKCLQTRLPKRASVYSSLSSRHGPTYTSLP